MCLSVPVWKPTKYSLGTHNFILRSTSILYANFCMVGLVMHHMYRCKAQLLSRALLLPYDHCIHMTSDILKLFHAGVLVFLWFVNNKLDVWNTWKYIRKKVKTMYSEGLEGKKEGVLRDKEERNKCWNQLNFLLDSWTIGALSIWFSVEIFLERLYWICS